MLSEKIKELSVKIESDFGGLNNSQLNWKVSPDQWSIGQCLQHVLTTNEQYLMALRKIADGTYKNSFWEKINPLTNYTGRQMIKTLGPVIIKKYKSPLIFSPRKSVNQNIVPDFMKQQSELEQLFMKIETEGNTERKITSPVARLITLKVKDVMNIIVAHEERHIQQALRIKSSDTFPS